MALAGDLRLEVESDGRAHKPPGVAGNIYWYKMEGEQVQKVGGAFPSSHGQFGVPTCSYPGSELESQAETDPHEAERIAVGG